MELFRQRRVDLGKRPINGRLSPCNFCFGLLVVYLASGF
ncbi:unnamed protein product [Linum tenue]|uniref:Uncharacterized protein n=1 Tax=Linum tenue TaxID=586396 RepID=A0AAV0H4S0_9ROSI|nr:unnamed protein product [Linum tenue]